eukprot:9474708-Pyramimonas_sp.AAC.1
MGILPHDAPAAPSPHMVDVGHARDDVALVDFSLVREDMGEEDLPQTPAPLPTRNYARQWDGPCTRSTLGRQTLVCLALFQFWVSFGFVSGFHLVVLLFLLYRSGKLRLAAAHPATVSRNPYNDDDDDPYDDDDDDDDDVEPDRGGDTPHGRPGGGDTHHHGAVQDARAPARHAFVSLILHVLTYWVAFAVFASGGWWCRTAGRYVECDPVGKKLSMSRNCLWAVQPVDYQIIYTLHYVALTYSIAHWVYDGAMLVSWGAAAAMDPSHIPLLFSTYPFWSAAYPAVLNAAVFLVTLTWTTLVDWSTGAEGGVRGLALVLLAEIAGVGLAAALALRWQPDIRAFRC